MYIVFTACSIGLDASGAVSKIRRSGSTFLLTYQDLGCRKIQDVRPLKF